jgi:hypothetical protein
MNIVARCHVLSIVRLTALLACLASPALLAEDRYAKTGAEAVSRIANDIYEALDAKPRGVLTRHDVMVKPEGAAFLTQGAAGDKGVVVFSSGFVELMNRLAHAKAIEKVSKGYFEKYVLSLGDAPQELPGGSDSRYWDTKLLDEQASSFSQMVGMMVAIEYSHHYLGHYSKYGDKVGADSAHPAPISQFLTADEWAASLRAGVRNCLAAGLGIEGVKALVDAIDKVVKRPGWAGFCIPDSTKAKALKKEMEKLERKFFGGEE